MTAGQAAPGLLPPHRDPGHEPLVAVVTPVYNGERFLAETMACVQAQTYPRLVHVLLDNASTDGTPAIIRRFEGGRVPLLHGRNAATLPAADNWNAALALVPPEAEWFRLLCADDLMVPAAIERKVALALANPTVGLVGCHWRAAGLCGSDLAASRTFFPGPAITRRYLRRETMVLSGMFTLIRCDLARARMPFYDGSIVGFDSDANLKILQVSDYGLVHEELVTWRHHAGSMTSALDDAALRHKADWLALLDRYGPAAMGVGEYRQVRRAFRRHYLRRLLRLLPGRYGLFRRHMVEMRRRDGGVGAADFADALWDWMKLALAGRRGEVGRVIFDP